MKPERIQLSRKKGWKLPANTVVVARPTKYGNPFIVNKHGTAAECVNLFRHLCAANLCVSVDRECVEAQKQFLKAHQAQKLKELRGKNLACWCRKDRACHADVLLEIANA